MLLMLCKLILFRNHLKYLHSISLLLAALLLFFCVFMLSLKPSFI